MKWISLRGKVVDIKVAQHLVDWDGDQGSRFSEEVLDWLHPYWQHDRVLAEMPVPGSRMRFDFVNLDQRIIIETDGVQHDQFSPHFHGSETTYRAHIRRDLDKNEVARLNGFKMVRINPSDLPLTREWFSKTYQIDL